MSQASPATPTLKPTNPKIIQPIPALKGINNGDNLLESNEKIPESPEQNKSGRRASLKIPKMSPSVYNNLINEHQTIYDPVANQETMEQLNVIKDYKWKLGMILIDKINSLKMEISEKRKEIEKLKNEKKEIIKKIKDIILLNKKLENKIIIEENKPKLIDDIALFLMNNNYLNNYPEIESNSYKENSILNIMDLGYCFENKKLINEFFDGLKKLLKIDDNVNNYNIITKLKELINIKNNYINEKNKFKNLFNENQKYFEYVQSLLNKFQINDISLLSDYIKKMYIKNIKESYTMKKIKVNLMKDMRAKKPTYLQKNKNDEIYNSNTERKTKFENSKKHYKKKTITFRNKIRYLSDANNSYFSDNQYYTQNNYDINFKLDNSSGYTICSNGKDKIIRVNKREINKDKQKNQKNLIEKLKSNKINNIIELDRINNSKKLGHSFELI